MADVYAKQNMASAAKKKSRPPDLADYYARHRQVLQKKAIVVPPKSDYFASTGSGWKPPGPGWKPPPRAFSEGVYVQQKAVPLQPQHQLPDPAAFGLRLPPPMLAYGGGHLQQKAMPIQLQEKAPLVALMHDYLRWQQEQQRNRLDRLEQRLQQRQQQNM